MYDKILLELDILIEDIERYYGQCVNLPRYKCRCSNFPRHNCQYCGGSGSLSYNEAMRVYDNCLPLGLQIPQCHICTRFDAENNPLFAYSYLESNGEFKFIYRCEKGHDHDHGMIFVDLHTGLGVYC